MSLHTGARSRLWKPTGIYDPEMDLRSPKRPKPAEPKPAPLQVKAAVPAKPKLADIPGSPTRRLHEICAERGLDVGEITRADGPKRLLAPRVGVILTLAAEFSQDRLSSVSLGKLFNRSHSTMILAFKTHGCPSRGWPIPAGDELDNRR